MLVACEWEELNSNHLLVSWEVIKRSNKLLFEWTNFEQSFKFNGNLSPHNCLWNFLLRYLRHFHKFSPSLTSTRKTLMIHKKISVFTTRRYSKIIGNKVFIPIVSVKYLEPLDTDKHWKLLIILVNSLRYFSHDMP